MKKIVEKVLSRLFQRLFHCTVQLQFLAHPLFAFSALFMNISFRVLNKLQFRDVDCDFSINFFLNFLFYYFKSISAQPLTPTFPGGARRGTGATRNAQQLSKNLLTRMQQRSNAQNRQKSEIFRCEKCNKILTDFLTRSRSPPGRQVAHLCVHLMLIIVVW